MIGEEKNQAKMHAVIPTESFSESIECMEFTAVWIRFILRSIPIDENNTSIDDVVSANAGDRRRRRRQAIDAFANSIRWLKFKRWESTMELPHTLSIQRNKHTRARKRRESENCNALYISRNSNNVLSMHLQLVACFRSDFVNRL